VGIRYSDLRHWLLAQEITSEAEVLPPVGGRVDIRTAGKNHTKTGNLELLAAAREQASNNVARSL
jgi:hypothetical protein